MGAWVVHQNIHYNIQDSVSIINIEGRARPSCTWAEIFYLSSVSVLGADFPREMDWVTSEG